jgi:hypothetical protein
MTAEEIHGMAIAQGQVLQKFNQPQPAAGQPNRFDLDLPNDDDYIQGRDVKRLVQQMQAQNQQGDPVARQLGAQNIWGMIQLQQADAFKRWSTEIQAEAGRLPLEHWTLDNLTTIVNIVRAGTLTRWRPKWRSISERSASDDPVRDRGLRKRTPFDTAHAERRQSSQGLGRSRQGTRDYGVNGQGVL